MLIFKTQDGKIIRRASKWIKLRERNDGSFYFKYNGLLYNLASCYRYYYPEFFEDETGGLAYLSANCEDRVNGEFIGVEFDYNGEPYIRLYRYVDNKE